MSMFKSSLLALGQSVLQGFAQIVLVVLAPSLAAACLLATTGQIPMLEFTARFGGTALAQAGMYSHLVKTQLTAAVPSGRREVPGVVAPAAERSS